MNVIADKQPELNHSRPKLFTGGLLTVRLVLGLLIILHGLPFLFKDLHPWGLDQWQYIPEWLARTLLVAGILLLQVPVSRILARPAEWIDGFATKERPWGRAALLSLVCLASAAAIFWRFSNATHFLGDGFLWANHLMGDIVFREPVSTWLYRGIYRGLNDARIFGEINPVMSSAITSILAGLVFIVFAHKTAKLLAEKRGDYILLIASLFSCGTIMLFFGYVETYPPLAAGVMAFIFFALRWMRRGGSIIAAVMAFLATVILHLSAIALLPGLLILLHYHAGKDIDRKQLKIFLIAVIAAGFGALWALQATGAFGGFFSEHFLPLFGSHSNQDVAYPIFSLRALFDNVNELLLIVPLAVLLPVLLVRGHKGGSRERIFLATCALFYFLAFIAFNKIIGTSRDWDLFSPLAIPMVLWIAILIRDVFPKRRGEFTILIAAVIITHTAPWIILNSDLVKSEERFVDMCDNGYWSNRAKGYGHSTLGQYYRHHGKTLQAIQFYGRAAVYDPGNVKYSYYAGEMYSGLGKHGAALEQYFKVLERQGGHFEALYNSGVSYLYLGRPAEAEPYFKRALEVDPSSVKVLQNLGYIYLVTGRAREAVGSYLQAVELEPANPVLHVNLAKAFVAFGDIDSARRHVDAARSIDPGLPESLLDDIRKEIVTTPAD